MFTIYKTFHFDAAHYLPLTPADHKCHRLHGHTYFVTVRMRAAQLDSQGWVTDFGEVKKYFKPLEEQLDHACLNEISGLENPTCENLAVWIYNRLKSHLPLISEIEVQETPTSGCVYSPGG